VLPFSSYVPTLCHHSRFIASLIAFAPAFSSNANLARGLFSKKAPVPAAIWLEYLIPSFN
jgi:hypothetical protein